MFAAHAAIRSLVAALSSTRLGPGPSDSPLLESSAADVHVDSLTSTARVSSHWPVSLYIYDPSAWGQAENERMHLLTFIKLKNPGIVFRAAVLGAQGM